MAELQGSRVLVTGASGFIGSHLVRRLVRAGADLHLLSRETAVFPNRLLDVRADVTLHEATLTDRGAMDELAARARPSVVFHLAAYSHGGKSWQHLDECLQVNVQGTLNLLAALEHAGYDRFVYCGTGEIYGSAPVPFREDDRVSPVSPYSVSKYAAERYCRMFHEARGWPIVCARPFNAYGPAQTPDRVIPEVIVGALRREELKMTSGRQTRDFVYVEDLADGLVKLGTVEDIEGEVVNLGTGSEVSLREVAKTILELMDHPIEPRFGALEDRPAEIWRMFCDSTKARKLLGWEPRTSLREGLERTIAWYTEERETSGSAFEV